MKALIPPGKSLRFYGLMAWLIPAVMAIVVCVFAFFGSAFVEFRTDQQRLLNQLTEDSRVIARRISAELLIGPRGAPDSVAESLKSELDLASIEVTRAKPSCWTDQSDTCTQGDSRSIRMFRRIPVVSEAVYVSTSRSLPSITSYLRISNLLWSTLPIALMLAVGLMFQRFIFKRHFLIPITSLVETSTGTRRPRSFWPRELREISDRLYRSFEQRDEAVFSQIARGVIHDLRTLLQSPLAALELAQEARNFPNKRAPRLDNLEIVAGEQLPKMREIIDTTLDGSREIPISLRTAALEETVTGAQHSLRPLLDQTGVVLRIMTPSDSIQISHDPVQLERALTNIIKNGIEACAEIEGSPKELLVELRQDANLVVISIEDSGLGLATESDKLFRPLKSTKPHGSGLGLVISRKIITGHGGELRPSGSKRLGGAKFEVILPNRKDAM